MSPVMRRWPSRPERCRVPSARRSMTRRAEQYRATSARRSWPRRAQRCRTPSAARRPAPGRAPPLARTVAVNPRARTCPGTAPILLSPDSTPCSGFRRPRHRPSGPPRPARVPPRPALVPPRPPSGSSPWSGRARRPGPHLRRRNGSPRPGNGTSRRGRAWRGPAAGRRAAQFGVARPQMARLLRARLLGARLRRAPGARPRQPRVPGAQPRVPRGARAQPTAAQATHRREVPGRHPGPVTARTPRPARRFPLTRWPAAATGGPAGRGSWPGWPRWRSWA